MAVEHKQVVDVDADDDQFLARSVTSLPSLALLEQARVVVRRLEALRDEPREDAPLPTPARLRHAVDRLVDAADAGLAVGAEAAVAVKGQIPAYSCSAGAERSPDDSGE
eukprot:4778276-Prymnesium_polylepis.1